MVRNERPPEPAPHPVLDRGALALALAGTIGPSRGERLDLLSSPSQLAAWLEEHRDRLKPPSPETGARLGRFRSLRDAVCELLDAAASTGSAPGGALEAVNEASASAACYPVLAPAADHSGTVELRTVSGDATNAILGAIARSAIELLSGPDRDRIRICGAPGCGRFFVAARRGRVWCSNACGNRARVARHHARNRVRGGAS